MAQFVITYRLRAGGDAQTLSGDRNRFDTHEEAVARLERLRKLFPHSAERFGISEL